MTTQIKNEIKDAAIRQYLSSWSSSMTSSALFDAINVTSNVSLDQMFEQHEVLIWEPFENFSLEGLVDEIIGFATRTQALLDGPGKNDLMINPSGPIVANLFFKELTDSVETLSGIGEMHGIRTMADLMWLQNVILTDSRFQIFPEENSKVLEVIQTLPSATHWVRFLQE